MFIKNDYSYDYTNGNGYDCSYDYTDENGYAYTHDYTDDYTDVIFYCGNTKPRTCFNSELLPEF